MGQALGSSVLSPDNLAPVLGEEMVEPKQPRGTQPLLNLTTCRKMWECSGGAPGQEWKVSNTTLGTLSHCRGLDWQPLPRGAVGLWSECDRRV